MKGRHGRPERSLRAAVSYFIGVRSARSGRPFRISLASGALAPGGRFVRGPRDEGRFPIGSKRPYRRHESSATSPSWEYAMTLSEVTRTETRRVSDERTMLDEWLEYHRATLLIKCAGLDDEQLRRRSCERSTRSLLGLVGHVTDVERGWFLRGVARQSDQVVPPLYYSDDNPEGDFDDVDVADPRAMFDAYDQACADVRATVAGADLDDTF